MNDITRTSNALLQAAIELSNKFEPGYQADASWYGPELKALRAAIKGAESAAPEPRDRQTAAFWRDDAFENAAKICERYEAHDAARDIRHLKGSSPPPVPVLGSFWASLDANGALRRYDGGEPVIFHRKGEFAEEAAARDGGRLARVDVYLTPTKGADL